MVTTWVPSRYLQDSIWDGLAYAAVAITEGSAVARNTTFQRFVERHYAAEWTETWADVFATCYSVAPYRKTCSRPWMEPRLNAPWRNEQELSAVLKMGSTSAPPYTHLRSQMVYCETQIRKNLQDFRAFELSAEYLEHVFWRNTAVVREAGKKDGDKESATLLIRTIAERDQRLLALLDADWNQGRPSDAPAKLEPLVDLEAEDQLLFRFRQAAAFSAQLAADPDHFCRLLKESATAARG